MSSSRVRKHWQPLSQPTQDRIRTLLLAIEASSQTAHQNRTNKSRNTTNPAKLPLTPDEYTEAITALTQKLLSRLPKMQFPSSNTRSATTAAAAAAQDIDFDYDATLHRTASLSANLTEATHSAKLLRASIRQEEADLKAERAELASLQENLKRSVNAQRDLEKRLHPLAKSLDRSRRADEDIKPKTEPDSEDEEHIADATLGTARRRRRDHHHHCNHNDTHDPACHPSALLSESAIASDERLQPLATQLRSHLASMAANANGLRGVAGELQAAEAALAAFAWRGLSRERYERVVGLR